MAQLLINDNEIIKGDFTIKRYKDNEGNILYQGVLLSHIYIEEILSIESDRYIISDVIVECEEFGSNDYLIKYEFTAKDLDVKGGASNLTEELRAKIEKEFDNKLLPGGENVWIAASKYMN